MLYVQLLSFGKSDINEVKDNEDNSAVVITAFKNPYDEQK